MPPRKPPLRAPKRREPVKPPSSIGHALRMGASAGSEGSERGEHDRSRILPAPASMCSVTGLRSRRAVDGEHALDGRFVARDVARPAANVQAQRSDREKITRIWGRGGRVPVQNEQLESVQCCIQCRKEKPESDHFIATLRYRML